MRTHRFVVAGCWDGSRRSSTDEFGHHRHRIFCFCCVVWRSRHERSAKNCRRRTHGNRSTLHPLCRQPRLDHWFYYPGAKSGWRSSVRLLGRESVHGAAPENFFLLTVLAVTDRHPTQTRICAGFLYVEQSFYYQQVFGISPDILNIS